MFSQDSARPGNEQHQDVIPTPVGKGNDTPYCTGPPDADIAADDRPREEADQKQNTGTISDHQGSDVSANNANDSASDTNNSSVTDEQRGPVSVYNLRVRSNSHADIGASHGDISESVHPVTRTTAATTRANRDSVRRDRGFGRGRKKTHLLKGVLTSVQCSVFRHRRRRCQFPDG